MRILIAPDKFKGSLSAPAAAEAIARGFRAAWPDVRVDMAPIADGGEGFAESLAVALDAEWVKVPAVDAIGRQIEARYGWLPAQRLAIIDMSEASGLWRLRPEERVPLCADTFGTGILLADAVARGANRVVVGLGGSATTDGGVGLARAIGYRFFDVGGGLYSPSPGTLHLLDRIEQPHGLRLPEVIAACDVQCPLLGERGAAAVYSPQKGADACTVVILEEAMRRLADVCESSLGRDERSAPGAGAAGGLGFGLLMFCGAAMRPGFDIVAETVHLGRRIGDADLVITGEGCLDGQTLDGKGPAGVAAMARKAGKRVIAFGGAVAWDVERAGLFDAIIPIADRPLALADALREAAALLEHASFRAARLMGLAR